MKNLSLSCLLSLGLLLPLSAQITITNSVFPALGDTLRFAVDNQPQGIVMTPPGGDQQWDFSNLQPSYTFEQIFQDGQAGPDFDSFPSATLYYQTTTPEVDAYLQVSAQNVSLLGISGPDPSLLSLDLIAEYYPPIVQSRAPVNFFDIHQTSSGLLLPFHPSILPGVGQLPVNPDSMRLRVAINRLDAVDAWGSLSIPGGTFDVLREKRTQYTETRLDAKIAPLGWLDVTDIAIQYLQLSPLGVDTTVTYYFLNDQSKEPIAICTTDNTQLQVVTVQYKNVDIPSGVNKVEPAVAGLEVFPNPAGDILQIRASNLEKGDYLVVIYSMVGPEVYRKSITSAPGQLEEVLDIAGLEKGMYVCQLSNGKGQMEQAVFVKQ
ncbi:MAG: T9SS type A sorting domain-containing protein [Lewinellaceae bacterium]|nr:T9SS type A sorting domain-containing protein [Lewinellaceae bacterium]